MRKTLFNGALLLASFLLGPGSPNHAVAGGVPFGSTRMLNPQPLPPRTPVMLNAGSRFVSPGSKVFLNPQPLPPGVPVMKNFSARFVSPGSKVSLNPQPLPPGRPVLNMKRK